MRIYEVTYGKLKTKRKVNGNLEMLQGILLVKNVALSKSTNLE